ncbi:hypothetical protein BH23ACT6_BH23ACT6_03790 [soil metagenome]
MAYIEKKGMEAMVGRAKGLAESLPTELVYPGFSFGVVPAQQLAQTRHGARGALLFYSCLPAGFFGPWPAGQPAQVHGMDRDPIFAGEGDLDAARELAAQHSGVEVFLYPGEQHYFADSSLPSYDVEATAVLTGRVLEFLATR